MLSASSFLADGLPFAVFTPSFHYVTAVNLEQHEPPPNLQLRKYFYRGHVDELEDKVIEVRALGSAVVEEWSKGLGSVGTVRREDAARFERWELSVTAHLHLEAGSATYLTPSSLRTYLPSSRPPVLSDESGSGPIRDISMRSPLRPLSAQSSLYSGQITGKIPTLSSVYYNNRCELTVPWQRRLSLQGQTCPFNHLHLHQVKGHQTVLWRRSRKLNQ